MVPFHKGAYTPITLCWCKYTLESWPVTSEKPPSLYRLLKKGNRPILGRNLLSGSYRALDTERKRFCVREKPPWWEELDQRDAGQARPWRMANAVAVARFSQLVLLKIWVR